MSRAIASTISSLSRRVSVDRPFGKRCHSGPFEIHSIHQPSSTTAIRWGHTVRLIALEDLPHSKAYREDVLHVKAGYARNYLLPKKMALYATPQNFDRLGMIDPDVETEEQRLARVQRESSISAADDKYLKQADILKKYLKNKTLKIWRVVDPNSVDALHPGEVNAKNLRQKLSKQLKIDLEDDESIHICSETPIVHNEMNDSKVQTMVDEFVTTGAECHLIIKRLGEYIAKVSIRGGYSVPLKFVVLQRVP